jgi:hypothetical protein
LKVEAWWKKALDRNILGRIIKESQGPYRTVEPEEEEVI